VEGSCLGYEAACINLVNLYPYTTMQPAAISEAETKGSKQALNPIKTAAPTCDRVGVGNERVLTIARNITAWEGAPTAGGEARGTFHRVLLSPDGAEPDD